MGWASFEDDKTGAAIHAGFLGFAGSGKTTTAFLLAALLAKQRGRPVVAMLDTEGGGRWISKAAKAVGVELVGTRARSFQALLAFIQECEKRQPGAVVIDSLSHIWRDLCDAHLERINSRQRRNNRPERDKLEFQDWSRVKGDWQAFADWLTNTPLDVMVCGRAGHEYAMETNDRGQRELVKTAIKMKAEGEFTFEPDVVVEMRRIQEEGKAGFILSRECAFLKARGMALDGAVVSFPRTSDPLKQQEGVRAAFAEILEFAGVGMGAGAGITLDASVLPDEENNRIARGRALADIKGYLAALHPGQTNDAKAAKAALVMELTGQASWLGVEGLPIEALEDAVAKLKSKAEGSTEVML